MAAPSKKRRLSIDGTYGTHDDTLVAEPETPSSRLSRHIPQRDEMDIAASSFALTDAIASSSLHSNSTRQESWSMDPALGENSSTYAEVLADRIGGRSRMAEVLRFGNERPVNTAVPLTVPMEGKARKCRVINSNPDKVLDAPDLGTAPAQMIHWGSNNSVIIGLKSSLYQWHADTGSSRQLLQLTVPIHCVSWLPKSSCAAITVDSGVTYFYDAKSEKFLRLVTPPDGAVTCTAFSQSIMAAASGGPNGNVHVFDLRQKDALTMTYEAHRTKCTSLHYCESEPFYLASGGVDGTVKVWDARRPSNARYSFPKLHTGAVSSLLWNPDKRSLLYSGGSDDHTLKLINTHAAVADDSPKARNGKNLIEAQAVTKSPITGIASTMGTGEVLTAHGVGGGHLQIRKASTFQQIGTLQAPGTTNPIVCITVAPDRETICAGQDETLKFWKAFERPQPKEKKETRHHTVKRSDSNLEDCLR